MAKGVKKENLYVIHTKGDSEMSNNRLGIDNEIYIKNHIAIDTDYTQKTYIFVS